VDSQAGGGGGARNEAQGAPVSPTARALLEELLGDSAALSALRAALAVDVPQTAEEDGYLAPAAAARYLGITRKRVYDLTSARALVPDGRDGRTPLYTRSTLDAYARSSARR
jgi:hypothetical protein